MNRSNLQEKHIQNEDYENQEEQIAQDSIDNVEVLQSPTDETTTPHDAFDWKTNKRNQSNYKDSEKEVLDAFYKDSYIQIKNKQIVDGTIVGIVDGNVVMSVGAKFDGLIPLNEFKDYDEELKVGDQIPIMVLEKEDAKGNLILSYKETKIQQAWEKIVKAFENDEIVIGQVVAKSKGGLIVNLYGLEVFLPGSQIDVKVVTDYDQYLNKKMEFKVIKLNENIRNAVISHKAVIENKIEEQRMGIIEQLEKGQVVEGIVKNITDFGVFMDLGNIDGLLYITDISWQRISHPSELFEVDQKVNVVILDFDYNKKRISLGLKQLTPHPWDTLPETIVQDSIIDGKVVNIEDYGGFLEVHPGVEGLVHVSEIAWANTPVNPKDFFNIGEVRKVKVITLDKDARKMSLSIKHLEADPWNTISTKFPEGSKHKGTVKNITNYGVFVEMENGFGGMIHISDLSWTKRINHPKEVTQLGDVLDVVVLNVDQEHRKILLGHKQAEPNPWDLLKESFAIGTTHQGKILRKNDGGGIIEFDNEIEGYASNKHLMTKENKPLLVGETANFIVLEFEADNKKLILSHRKIWELEKDAHYKVKSDEQKEVKRHILSHNKTEKSVLGDIEGLADFKKKLQGEDSEDFVIKKEQEKPKQDKELGDDADV